jgi:hypothetical protein
VRIRQIAATFSHFAVLPLLVVITGCTLTQKPTQTFETVSTPIQSDSFVTANAFVTFDELQAWGNHSIPAYHDESGTEGGGCKIKKKGFKLKLGDLKWHVRVWRHGPVQITNNAGKPRIAGRFEVWANVKCRIKIAGVTVLSISETLSQNGIADITVDVDASVSELYKLQASLKPDAHWVQKPEIKVAKYLTISIGTLTMRELTKSLDRAANKAEGDLAKTELRSKIEKAWADAHKPLTLSLSEADAAWLRIRPVGIHSSPLETTPTEVRFRVAVRARPRIQLGVRPEDDISPDLPIKNTLPPKPDFDIRLETALDYSELERLLLAKLGETEIDVDQGTLKFTGLRAFQVGTKLAIGIRFRAKPRKFIPISGNVWLVGTPTLDPNGTLLAFPDLDYTISLNNPLLNPIDWVLHDEVREKLRESAIVDFGELIARLKNDLQKSNPIALSDTVNLNLDITSGKLEYFLPGAEELLIGPNVSGPARIAFSLPLPAISAVLPAVPAIAQPSSTIELEVTEEDSGRVLGVNRQNANEFTSGTEVVYDCDEETWKCWLEHEKQ